MGVVYSTNEVLHGELPLPGEHQEAAAKVLDQVAQLEPATLTVVHGSVINGSSNIRSDLDVLVAYDSTVLREEPVHERAINDVLSAISADTKVKVEANIWPTHEHVDARRERMYDVLFSRHLARSMTDTVWASGEPDESTLEVAAASYGDDEAMRRFILNYLTYKHNGFTKAPSNFDQSDKSLAVLQRAFEFPKSLGRKVAQMHGRDEEATAAEDWAALVSSDVNDETLEALCTIHDLDKEYTHLLSDMISCDAAYVEGNIAQYTEWLRRTYPRAIDLGIVATSGFTQYVTSSWV